MMKELIDRWFKLWEEGRINELPLHHDFEHLSPQGRIVGKENFISVIQQDLDNFTGFRYSIHEFLHDSTKAAVNYKMERDSFSLEVSEWIFTRGDLIHKVWSYYHLPNEVKDSG